jgi:hypothetical protein
VHKQSVHLGGREFVQGTWVRTARAVSLAQRAMQTVSSSVKKRTASQTARPEPPCNAGYSFHWGQHSEGWIAARAGSPCRVRIGVSGTATISSAQIIEGPHSGTAETGDDGSIRFQPNAGFTGKDTMTVRYRGTGPTAGDVPDWRTILQATVTLSITVF